LRLDVYPVWMHLLRALPGSVRDSASAVNRSWYKVEMRGNIGGQVDYRQEILPIIVDPIRRFINRMSPPPPTSR